MQPIQIGDFQLSRVVEMEFPAFSAKDLFPDITPWMIAEIRRILPDCLDQDDKVLMSFQSFIIKTGRATILIDTCCNKSRRGRGQFDAEKRDYMSELARAGVHPEDITHVMCTHLHWDHIGWNTRLLDGQWVPTFPNARYIIAKREYDYWNGIYADRGTGVADTHADAFEDSVLPLLRAERVDLVADDHEVDHGIAIEPCPGHTPGHVCVNVQSATESGALVGDAIHAPLQLLYPDLSCRADADMDVARRTRRDLLERYADTATFFMPSHFPGPVARRLKRLGDTFTSVLVEQPAK